MDQIRAVLCGKELRWLSHQKNFGYYEESFHKYLCQISNQSQIFLHLMFYTTFSSTSITSWKHQTCLSVL